jgi:hypothetical protein
MRPGGLFPRMKRLQREDHRSLSFVSRLRVRLALSPITHWPEFRGVFRHTDNFCHNIYTVFILLDKCSTLVFPAPNPAVLAVYLSQIASHFPITRIYFTLLRSPYRLYIFVSFIFKSQP